MNRFNESTKSEYDMALDKTVNDYLRMRLSLWFMFLINRLHAN